MRRSNTLRKKIDEANAQALLVPFLEDHLVLARNLNKNTKQTNRWGIVVPLELIKEYARDLNSEEVENRVWALWKDSKLEAIQAYQSARESILQPYPTGLLTNLNIREWGFEIVDDVIIEECS